MASMMTPKVVPTFTARPPKDVVCTDGETFEDGIALHFSGSRLTRMGNGKLLGVDWSADGTKIAVASETGVYIFDAVSMEQVRYIETPYSVEVVRFSPDGQWLATDDAGQVSLWDVKTAARIAQVGSRLHFHSALWGFPFNTQLGNITFHPDGKRIVVHSVNHAGIDSSSSIEIWDIQSQTLVQKISTGGFAYPDPIFSPDGKWVASSWSDSVVLFDGESLQEVRRIVSTSRHVSFSPDSKRLILSEEGSIKVVDLEHNLSVVIFPGNTYEPATGVFTADGKKIVTHYSESQKPYPTPLAVWDAESGEKLLELHTPDYVIGLALNPTRNELATVGHDEDGTQMIRVWDLETGANSRALKFSRYLGGDIAVSADGSKLIVEQDQRFHLYNTQTGGYLCDLQELIEKPYFVSFSDDGEHIAAISLNGKATVWNLETGRAEQSIREEATNPGTSDGWLVSKKLPFEHRGWPVIAWAWTQPDRANSRWIINTCDAGTSIPTDCPGAIHPSSESILTINEGLVVQDADTLEILGKLEESRGATNFTFSPDGRYILALSYLDWTIDIRGANTYQKVTTINSGMEGEGPILGNQEFSFTQDGTLLATYLPYFGKDSIRIWNTTTWKQEKSVDTKGGVWDVSISGNGDLVAGSAGYVIYFWNLDD